MQLKDVKGIGPKSLSLLNKININSVEDLVTHYPFRYEILERCNLAEIEDGGKIIIDGKILSCDSNPLSTFDFTIEELIMDNELRYKIIKEWNEFIK